MKTEAIMALPVPSIADVSAHLYLWATNNHLVDALAVVAAWGFDYKTMVTWGKDKQGLGQYFRGMTEHCLFATRGPALPYRFAPSGKRAQGRTLILEPRREHSAKPEQMRRMVELVSYEPRIELFARGRYPGWDVWGDEAEGSIALPSAPLKSLSASATSE